MKTIITILLALNLLGGGLSGAWAQISREEAVVKARTFLSVIKAEVNDSLLEMRDSPERRTYLGGHYVWMLSWSGTMVSVSAESGEILMFVGTCFRNFSRDRFERGEMPTMMSEEEAIRQAREFAQQREWPLSETRIETAEIIPFGNPASEDPKVGEWSISFGRYYQGYRMPDYFRISIEPYEKRIVGFLVNWGTPVCETKVNLSEAEATRLALGGLAARGISAIKDENPEHMSPVGSKIVILRPNYTWTEYEIPSDEVPFARLLWFIPVALADGSPLGSVYIDAATGDWLGGGKVGGTSSKMKSVPPPANAKAFLVSRFARSTEASPKDLPHNLSVALHPKDKTRWAALGSLLASLRPLQLPPSGPGQECLTFTEKEKTYHLQRVKTGLRLEGPDVPGGAIGFAAGKDFAGKLVGIAAPLAGAKKPPVAKK